MVLLQRKLYFSKDPVGVQHFFFFLGGGGGGNPTFSKGVQVLISIETHITCDFPGGFGPPIPFGSAHETRGILIGCFTLLELSLSQNYLR